MHKIDEDEESPGSSDPVEALCSSGPTSSEYSDCVVVEVEKRSVKKENSDRKKKGKKDQQKKSV